MPQLNPQVVRQNTLVLANAAALGSAIIQSMSERHVSRTLNAETLTRDRIEQLILVKLSASLTS